MRDHAEAGSLHDYQPQSIFVNWKEILKGDVELFGKYVERRARGGALGSSLVACSTLRTQGAGKTVAELTGFAYSGLAFRGSDSVRIVPR
jgi:hypothetical protein